MIPLKPYLIRAVYEWITDNDLTPYLLVNADRNTGNLPADYVEDGKILLNIKQHIVEALHLGDSAVEFVARFKGEPTTIEVSINAIMAIYAKENGKGMFFDHEPDGDDNTPPPEQPTTPNKPKLKVVK